MGILDPIINNGSNYDVTIIRVPRAIPIRSPDVDKIELVSNEEEPGRSTPPVEDSDEESDTDSIPDLSREQGLRFHLKKKGG